MTNTTDRLGIEFISVFGQPPVDFINLSADLGCHHIGLALAPFTANPYGFPLWSLREDKALRRDVSAALKARSVSISLGEGFLVHQGIEARNYAGDLDIMAELGAVHVNALSIEPDLARSYDQLSTIAELASARGLKTLLEYMPGMAIGTLADAIAAVDQTGDSNMSVLLDMMHFMRSGGSPAELKAAGKRVGYIQMCDAPLVATNPNYGAEARDNRLAPGEGELPILEILKALPKTLIVGIEAPMLVKAAAGMAPNELLAPSVAKARELLEQAVI